MRPVRLEPRSSNQKSFLPNQAAAQLADLKMKNEKWKCHLYIKAQNWLLWTGMSATREFGYKD